MPHYENVGLSKTGALLTTVSGRSGGALAKRKPKKPGDALLFLQLKMHQAELDDLTPLQRQALLNELDLMIPKLRSVLGEIPEELQRGDVVKVYQCDEEYHGLVIRATDDLVRLKCLTSDGTMYRRTFHYANGWEIKEFMGQRGWQNLITFYLSKKIHDQGIFQVIVERDREFALELFQGSLLDLWDKQSLAHALDDEDLILATLLEIIDEIGYSSSAWEVIEAENGKRCGDMSLYVAAILRLQLYDGNDDPRRAFVARAGSEWLSEEEITAILLDGLDGSIPYAKELIHGAVRWRLPVIDALKQDSRLPEEWLQLINLAGDHY